jgi:ABC-type Fe3+/spermidine/putrescine transport system ATPase subunit
MLATVVSVADGRVSLRTRGGATLAASDDGQWRQGAEVWVGLRPETLRLVAESSDAGQLRGTVEDEVYLGDRTEWIVRVAEERLTVSQAARHGAALRRGAAVSVAVAPGAVLRLDDPPAPA